MDSQIIVPRVLSAASFQLKSANAKTFAEKAGAIAAINANYFDEKGRPLAYLKTAEKEINRSVSKHRLYTGVFGVSETGPFVTHRDEFQPQQASAALQSGPLLLHRRAPVELMGGLGRYARRSVIATDKEGRVIIGVADGVIGGLSFSELQELFVQPRWQLDAVELLNLDGGGSAQLYVKSGKFEEWLPGTSEVPVAIGFFLKKN
jgi:exopolysaccharide biosynthesis protein